MDILEFYENNYDYDFHFICPVCNQSCYIETGVKSYLYSVHQGSNPKCYVDKYLDFMGNDWNITRLKKYKKRLQRFYSTPEHKTIIKQEIINQL